MLNHIFILKNFKTFQNKNERKNIYTACIISIQIRFIILHEITTKNRLVQSNKSVNTINNFIQQVSNKIFYKVFIEI